MMNCGFKKALLGQKCILDSSWPRLNHPHNATKRASKNHFLSATDSDVTKEIITCDIESPSAHSKQTYVPFANDDFPELACSSSARKQNTNSKNNSVLVNTLNYSKIGLKHPKNSKLKHDLFSIPLLSFVKIRINKKKTCHKKSPHSKHPTRPFCGNKLDRDNPLRRKGKVRLNKKKYESRLRKEIILSRRIKNKAVVYNKNILNIKALLPSVFSYDNEQTVYKLGALLGSLNLEEKQEEIPQSVVPDSEDSISDDSHAKKFAKIILHSNNYREYCTNIVTKSLLERAENLVTTLRNFQDRQYAKDPGKAFAKRRYLCGFKETKKFLLADRVKIIIIATNLQLETDLPSGRVLEEITSVCQEKNIPVVYAGRGNQIGHWTLKRRRISIVAILNHDGAEEALHKLMAAWTECKEMYKMALQEIEHRLPPVMEEKVVDKSVEEEIRVNIISKLSANGDKLIK